jgi:hypothetical protein
MKIFFALCTALLFSSPVFAALPSFEPLVEKLVKEGEVSRNPDFTAYHFANGNLDRNQPRLVDYVTAMGMEFPNGSFRASNMSLVKEDWRVNAEGNWEIEQWIRVFGMSGNLYQLQHALIIETRSGTVLDYNTIPTGGISDEKEIQAAEQEMLLWYQRLDL